MTSLSKYEPASDIIFRVAFSLIFIVGGLIHFFVRGPGAFSLDERFS